MTTPVKKLTCFGHARNDLQALRLIYGCLLKDPAFGRVSSVPVAQLPKPVLISLHDTWLARVEHDKQLATAAMRWTWRQVGRCCGRDTGGGRRCRNPRRTTVAACD